jgi:uncharacterized cupredoxin-like copper-binding protein
MHMLPIRCRWSQCGLTAGAAVLALVVAGCGGGHESAGSDRVVSVTESDFKITAPKQLEAGALVLRVRNRGPVGHELLVVRIDQPALPMRTDGLTVDEESLQRHEVGVLEPAATGTLRDLAVRLVPGRYVLFCNMSGHFLSGMHTTLVVK